MPPCKKDKAKTASSSQESIKSNSVRNSSRLRGKKRPDYGALSGKRQQRTEETIQEESSGESTRSEGSQGSHAEHVHEHDHDEASVHSASWSGSAESGGETQDSAPQQSDGSTESEDETVIRLEHNMDRNKKLKKIEEDTRCRIESYKNMPHMKQKDEEAKRHRRTDKLKEVAEVELENKKRLELIAKLQQEEDQLASQLTGSTKEKDRDRRRSKKPEQPPSAHSTPKTKSEYNNIIQHLLNMSFNEDDLKGNTGGQRKLAPTKIREIQSLLEHTLGKDPWVTNYLCMQVANVEQPREGTRCPHPQTKGKCPVHHKLLHLNRKKVRSLNQVNWHKWTAPTLKR